MSKLLNYKIAYEWAEDKWNMIKRAQQSQPVSHAYIKKLRDTAKERYDEACRKFIEK